MKRTLSMILVLIFALCTCASAFAAGEQWVCEVCGTENDRNFCEECGAPRPSNEWTCPNCGSVNTTKFCPACGAQKPGGTPVPATMPVLRADPYSDDDPMVWGTDVARETVRSVTFLSTQDKAPASAVDVSEAGDRGVLLWFEPADDKYYDMYLAANGKMQAPENCVALFQNYTACTAIDFNGVLDTAGVTLMVGMFYGCEALTELDLSSFDTANVTNMSFMFCYCEALGSVDLSSFDTANVIDMSYMFCFCEALGSVDLSSFDTANVTSFELMFGACGRLQSLNIDNFVVSPDANTLFMFEGCAAISSSVNTDLAPTPTPVLTPTPVPTPTPTPRPAPILRMDEYYNEDGGLFDRMVWGTNVARARVLSVTFLSSQEKAPASAIDVSEAGDRGVLLWFQTDDDAYYDMYIAAEGKIQAPRDCTALFQDYVDCEAIRFNGLLDTSNVRKMKEMFGNCWDLSELDLSFFDTANVTDMSGMFKWCESLKKVDLSSFDTSSVTDMGWMFYGCEELTQLDLSAFDTANVTTFEFMFDSCAKLKSLNIDNFVVAADADVYGMFDGCTALPTSVYSRFAATTKPTAKPTAKPTVKATTRPTYPAIYRDKSGDAVRRLQNALIAGGYLAKGEADGKYGRKTAEAVHRYKAQNNISDSTTHSAGECVATDEMQAKLFGGSSPDYVEPYMPLAFLSGSRGEWKWVDGNKLAMRFRVSNVSSTRKVTAFKIQAYAVDVWGDSLYGDSVYYETTTKTVEPSGNKWSEYIYLPKSDQIYSVYARISEVRLSDGTIIINDDYDFNTYWNITSH